VAGALEIRPATAADVPALRTLGVRAWHAAYDGVLAPAAIDAAVAESWNEYSLGAACRDARMLVATRGGAPVGLLESDRMADGRAVVWKLYVAPESQRTGVGRALLERCARALHPSEELWLEHDEVNGAAARFFARLGFTVRGVAPSEHDPAVSVVWRARAAGARATPAATGAT
jgi:ribosomal protein S18 acetylase RimI-like enzyme